jgi:hypothetical protein
MGKIILEAANFTRRFGVAASAQSRGPARSAGMRPMRVGAVDEPYRAGAGT